MRILTTTLHRKAKNTDTHGYLLLIDWGEKQVLKQIEAPPLWSHFDYRDRGGRRGLRGITFFKDLIWVASCETLFGLDTQSLELRRIISHPYMSHIHEIEATDEGIWVTSTGGNGIFLIDETQNPLKEIWLNGKPTEDLRIHLERERDKFHINSVFAENGEVFFYSPITGQVFRALPPPVVEVVKLETGCHNVVKTRYGWFRNVSDQAIVRIGEKEIQIPKYGKETKFTKPGWLRGMAWLSETRVLIGSSPAMICEIDIHELRIVDEFRIENDVCWTIHGIYVNSKVL